MLFKTETTREKLKTVYLKQEESDFVINDLLKPIKINQNDFKSFYFEVIPFKGIGRNGNVPPQLMDKLIISYLDPYTGMSKILEKEIQID